MTKIKLMILIGISIIFSIQSMFASDGRMTPELLWGMGRLGTVQVNKNNTQIAYEVRWYSVKDNNSRSEFWIMDTQSKDSRKIEGLSGKENLVSWCNNGNSIAFIHEGQVWTMNPDGTNKKQLTRYNSDIEGFAFSPDEQKILFIAQVKTVDSTSDIYPDLSKSSGKVIDDLMYKHWDEYVTSAPHPFVADITPNGLENVKDLLEGTKFESPLKPFGGIEQLAWSPDGRTIAYTCRKKTGLEYALSTNSDIYLYRLDNGTTINISEDIKGYDINPAFSPDGKYIAWQSMEHDGYESDWNRLMVLNLQTGERKFVSEAFKSNVDGFIWGTDSKNLYFNGVWHGQTHLYQVAIDKKENISLTQLTYGPYDYGTPYAISNNGLVVSRHSMSRADEIYYVPLNLSKKERSLIKENDDARGLARDAGMPINVSLSNSIQLTHINKSTYDQIETGKVEARWVKTTDNKEMLVWVIFPPKFNPSKKYPTLLFCEGGPQSPVSQFWSYRWNMQIMAANDYIVVAPNRRGLPGFGLEWNEAISGDYAGQCMQDYLSAIDDVCKEDFVDKDHLGCVGASFGGYSVYWLAGNHNKRFKAFIAHDGIFNLETQYLETEELWFVKWDLGGPYWEKNNQVAQKTYEVASPHKYVDKWDTPILCIHGSKDYRILDSQAMQAFAAAKLQGIPAQLLLFPDENHWVLKPQNGILWQRTFFKWLDRWLK